MRDRTFNGLAIAAALGAAVAGACSAASPGSSDAEPESPPTVVAVEVAPIVRMTLHGYVAAWGTVEPEPATRTRQAATARVSSLVPGLVAKVNTAEGQKVARGDVLFQLDTRVADVAVEKARQAVGYAEQVFARQKLLGPGEATSQRAYQEAEQNLVVARNELKNAEAQRALLTVESPIAGTVVHLNARAGDTVDLANVLADIVDLNRLIVGAAVRSVDIPRLKVGQPAELWTEREAAGAPAAGSVVYPSSLVFIGSEVNSSTDTLRVRLAVKPGAGLRPGQFVNLRIVAEEHRDRLAVPVAAVVTREGVSEVAIVTGDRAARRAVTVGLEDGGLVEIEGKGLDAGMTVVTEGAYGLPEESQIRVVSRPSGS